MSVVMSNLGWYVDSTYLCETANALFGVISDRPYKKHNNTDACIVYLRNYPSDYHQALTLSTTADGAKQYVGSTTFAYKWTVEIDGVTWYVNTGDNGFQNGRWTTANYPLLTDISIETIWYDRENSIRQLLQRAGYTTHEQYTVSFNSNGGAGSMEDMLVPVGAQRILPLNTFTKDGYEFAGWSLTQGGGVVYTDGQSIFDIAEAWETVTLYAVWTPERFKVILQRNRSDTNHVEKSLTDLSPALLGTLKRETSLLNPVLIVQGILEYVASANYMTIPKFGNRSYYITEIKSIKENIIEIHGRVDVLQTYKDIIRQQTAIVHRQERRYNMYLNDGVLKFYQNPNVITQSFPSGFIGKNPNLILIVAGNGGNPST